jgi:hypothetical protein
MSNFQYQNFNMGPQLPNRTLGSVPCSNNPIPSWIVLDEVNERLIINAPDVQATSNYTVDIKSTARGEEYTKTVHVEVDPVSEVVDVMPPGIQSMIVGTLAALGITMGVNTSVSIMVVASPNTVWDLLNSIQLFLTLPLNGAYLPDEVLDFVTGIDSALLNLKFIPIDQAPGINALVEYLNYDQEYDKLGDLGLESMSAFVNNLNILVILCVLITIHLCITPFYIRSKRKPDAQK